jgi:diguanylate cyclase (GGDEF)-like protein
LGEAAKNLNAPTALDMFRGHEHFTKCMLDAYAIVDTNGKVLKTNPLFSQLVGMRSRQILRADSFDELLEMGLAGKRLSINKILENRSPTRIDEVSGKSKDRDDLNLIIGFYPFLDDDDQLVGAFVLIRDVTAETNLQDKYKDKATQSITDALTGLYNRAYFVEYMTSQVSHLEKLPETATQKSISVIMIDIDHFKKTNDVYGHQAGDYVIKVVADIMKNVFRKTDIVCRYGGEEFLTILPGTELTGAATAAEKLRKTIAEYSFEFDETKIPVTISSGVAQILVGKETGDQTIARADAALYCSKDSGRNQVSIHNGSKPAPLTKK